MRTRTITAIIALLLFLPIVVLGNWPLLILVYLMAITALYEILKMIKRSENYYFENKTCQNMTKML